MVEFSGWMLVKESFTQNARPQPCVNTGACKKSFRFGLISLRLPSRWNPNTFHCKKMRCRKFPCIQTSESVQDRQSQEDPLGRLKVPILYPQYTVLLPRRR